MLFELRLRERIELHLRVAAEFGLNLPPVVLQKGEKVRVLDVAGETGWLCATRHGRVMLPPRVLKPLK